MKPFLHVEADRKNYHKFKNKNTVHRSSLIVPRFDQASSNISFLNHFLLKRNNKDVTLKITAINDAGIIIDSLSFEINEPRVYSFNLDNLFSETSKINEYIIEFFSDKNLFIPFPAVMVNHIGSDFVNSVHSFNRVLNDIFEDDKVNQVHVYESSVDVLINKEYDTFFNFATGPFKLKENIEIFFEEDSKIKKKIPIEMERLNNKNIFLSDYYKNKDENKSILKILQPKQKLFYGRLLAGKINKRTNAFSANHSYYDNSTVKEYFNNQTSRRTYPYFKDCLNKVIMYPIMSPSELEIFIEIYNGDKIFKSDVKLIKSPSKNSISFDIDKLVKDSGFIDVSLFKVVAKSSSDKIPTRIAHQLIYGDKKSSSELNSSIGTALINESIYNPSSKTGVSWGQVLINRSYKNKLGICFSNNSGSEDQVSIDFYGKSGLLKSIKQNLSPNKALIFDNKFFDELGTSNEFIWYIAKSKRFDLQAMSFHYHMASGNASGEHSF
ncbi:hypothetical protein [Candidatus Pelagibacter communis]|uniref:hypothetical protein n=1 Tax=Pelagibacter ubique TaxID=198252 RepID=UPI00094D331D|nr:hypothetical protein [Candidatus Pelagibacter ubique]|tara:strand:- start:15 stop:1499 length:1485 start_codon:yes stop_codon:yes gene_type:complete